ncbi:MAG: rod shape-determining protein MreD [Paramuribaculum sp.]|nr:rod shape-determining protein MreD [Paramuribaculum sp.]
MNRIYTTIIIWIPILIILQALVFNHICLFGYAVPFVFIYALLRLPLNMTKERTFTIGFLTGLALDIFSDTLGLNALCCTILMALRRPVARLYLPRDEELLEIAPGIKTYGIATFAKYTLTATLLFCTLTFLIESLDSLVIYIMCFKILASTLLTFALILGLDSLTIGKSEKRL